MIAVPVLMFASLLVPAAVPGAEQAPAPVAEAGQTPEPPPENPIAWALQSLGVFYATVFSGLLASLTALLVLNLAGLKRDRFLPEGLVAALRERFGRRRYREAAELAAVDGSPLGRIITAGMAAIPLGYDHAVAAMQETEREQTMAVEHRLGYLALIGTVAPMVGLLGTVQGMIASFSEIAHRHTTPEPWVLARGISTALFTTLVGLFIAIPAIAACNILRNRVARLRLELGQFAEDLLRRVETGVRS
jgi:biopolymer transport protein ExbB